MTEEVKEKDLENDYGFSRDQYSRLIEQGNDAIESMMALAKESDHPKAFEVLGMLLKLSADNTDKLMKLHRSRKLILKKDKGDTLDPNLAPYTENNLFVGSTSELQAMLKERKRPKEINDG